MLFNAGSLVGTTAVTSVLGFAYWWVAARRFSLESVGIASALIPAMMLLGGLCVLGLGTLLITELPRNPEQAGELLNTALLVVAVVGMGIGVIFALIAPAISPGFQVLRTSITSVFLFAAGISLTAVTLVLDQAFIGLLRGGLQLGRNTFFAFAKLLMLSIVGFLLPHADGITVYTTWTLGNTLSLWVLLFWMFSRRRERHGGYRPQWSLLRKLGGAAIQHHLLNLALQAPTLLLPLLVTTILSVHANAWFYVAWMIAGFVFIVPSALTTVLHAMNAAQTTTLAQKARATMGIAFLVSLFVTLALTFATKQVLGLFGNSYENAAQCLQILLLASFPLIIKNHYISFCRIQDRITQAMLAMAPGGLLELGAAILGAHVAGLTGLSIGWVVAISIESLFMLPTVYRVVRGVHGVHSMHVVHGLHDQEASPQAFDRYDMPDYLDSEAPVWLVDTLSLNVIIPSSMGIAIETRHEQQRQERRERQHISRLKPPRLEAYHYQGERKASLRPYLEDVSDERDMVGVMPRARNLLSNHRDIR